MSRIKLFETEKVFEDTFIKYLKDCEKKKKMPNVAGFAVFARIGRERFYEQKKLYPDTFELINAMLEDEVINSKNVSDTVRIFYMKNKCGYKDKIEEEVKQTQKIEIINDLGAIDED